jgi:hypothetical protein
MDNILAFNPMIALSLHCFHNPFAVANITMMRLYFSILFDSD